MCGIAGTLSLEHRNIVQLKVELQSMVEAIQHRGPDSDGYWISSLGQLACGHSRLAIQDVSISGHQPMVAKSGRYIIAFNGEIYNFQSLKREIEAEGGVQWKGHADTEVLLAAFDLWGIEIALKKAVGMFAIALWDNKENKLYLIRDRIGEKPLYYGWVGKVLVFASELKSFYKVKNWKEQINPDQLASYLRYSYLPGAGSIYKNVYKVRPGTILEFPIARLGPELPVAERQYWSLPNVVHSSETSVFSGSYLEGVGALQQQLGLTVKEQLIADVPLGVFLSGGVDSSLIAAIAQEQSRHPISTFTIGFNEKEFNEAPFAAKIAKSLGTNHTELYVSANDALKVIPSMADIYDEPFGDSSQIPTFLVAKLARQKVKVALTGDGADEIFGGYNRYIAGPLIWKNVRRLPFAIRKISAYIGNFICPSVIDRIYRSVKAESSRISMAGYKWQKIMFALDARGEFEFYKSLINRWIDAPKAVVGAGNLDLIDEIYKKFAPSGGVAEKMMYYDTLTYLPGDILVKVDRASMAVGLESRAPFLDHRVLQLAWRFPSHWKLNGGKGKLILRDLLSRYIQRELLERPKAGFAIPLDSWLRGELRPWAEELLSKGSLLQHGLLDPKPIIAMWNQHLKKKSNWQDALWHVLMFQAWYKRFHAH